MTDQINPFLVQLEEGPNPFLVEAPEVKEKAKANAMASREAAFALIASGQADGMAAYKMAAIEAEIAQNGVSADLEEIKSNLYQARDKGIANQADAIIASDMDVNDKIIALKQIDNIPVPKSVEDLALQEIQKNDSGYVSAIQAIQERVKKDGFLYEEEVLSDPLFAKAAKQIYGLRKGGKFKGTDEEAIKYGMAEIRRMANPEQLVSLPFDLSDEDDALAFMYMMTAMDAKESTWGGFFKSVGHIAESPVNILSTLLTLGAAPLAEQAAARGLINKVAADAVKKAVASQSSKKVVTTTSAAYAGSINLAQQQIEKSAGFREEVNKGEVTLSAGIGGLLGFTATFAGEKLVNWLGRKSPAKTLREAAPKAGRQVTKENISTGTEAAGEAPEASMIAMMPKSDIVEVGAGPSLFNDVEETINSAPLVSMGMTTEQLQSAQGKYILALGKQVSGLNRMVRPEKSVVKLDGDILRAEIAIGKDADVGYTTLKEAGEEATYLASQNSREMGIGILSRQVDGSLKPMSEAELQSAIRLEQKTPGKASGEYYLQVRTQRLLGEEDSDFSGFDQELVKGLSGKYTSLLGWVGQQDKRFSIPFLAATPKAAAFKSMLEKPVEALKLLDTGEQLAVNKALYFVEKNKVWMTPDEAFSHFNGNSDQVKAYLGFKQLSYDLYRISDWAKTRQYQKEGWFRYDIGELFGGPAKPAVADDFIPVSGTGKYEVFDLDAKAVVRVGKEDIANAIVEGRALKLKEPIKVGKNLITNVIKKDANGINKSILASTLKKREGYIPGLRKAVYTVVQKDSGYTLNGNPIAPNAFANTEEGQRVFVKGFADTEYDAIKAVEALKAADPDNEYTFKLTREAGGVDFAVEDGHHLNNRGLIYGARSEFELQSFGGAGKLKDILQSFETTSARIASMMSQDRVMNARKTEWLQTFAKPGTGFPLTSDEAARASATMDTAAQKKAMQAWRAIDNQRKFTENRVAKEFNSYAIGFANILARVAPARKLEGLVGKRIAEATPLLPVGRWLGRRAAEGRMITQELRGGSFRTQVSYSLAQWPMNLLQASGHYGFAAVVNPKVLGMAIKDSYSLMKGGGDDLLDRQLAQSGLLGTIDQHDLAAHVLKMAAREDVVKNKGVAGQAADAAGQFVAKFDHTVKTSLFSKPEQIQKTAAFVTQRRVLMHEKGIKDAAELTKKDLLEIAAKANAMAGAMDNSGRIPLYSAIGFDLLLQYGALPWKYTTLMLSAVPGLDKLPIAQKVIDKKYARRVALLSLGAFGASGIGSNETWNAIRQKFGIDPESDVDQFLRAGSLGYMINTSAEMLAESATGEDVDSDMAIASRFSPFGSSGADFFMKPYTLVSDIMEGGDPTAALLKFPATSLVGSIKNAYDINRDIWIDDLSPEELALDRKVRYSVSSVVEILGISKQIKNSYYAFKTQQLYDRLNAPTIDGVSSPEAFGLLFGVRPQEELDLWRVNKELSKAAPLSKNQVDEKARDMYDRVTRLLNYAAKNRIDVEQTRALLKANKLIFEMENEPNEAVLIRNKFYEMMNRRDPSQNRVDALNRKIEQIVFQSTYNKDTVALIKSINPDLVPEDAKKRWIDSIESQMKIYESIVTDGL